jgi:uroporphyrinogen decarboxylase
MLGYDYVPNFALVSFPHDNYLSADDTASLSRGQRAWHDEHHGAIRTRADFESYPWPSVGAMDYSNFERLESRLVEGMKVIGMTSGVLENVTWLTGYETLATMLYEDPGLARDLFDRIGEILVSVHAKLARMDCIGATAMGDDMGFKTATMISPKHLREYVFPWQKKIVEAVHARGKPFILHSCGNLKAVMDDLIDYVKIDAKHSYEDQIQPVTEAKKLYGNRLSVLGGVDMDFLCRSTPDDVRRYVRRVLEECAPGGGYCLGTGNSVANYVNLQNYLTMLDEGQRYRQ